MTLHAPAQHAGVATHHWLRDILIVGVVSRCCTIGGVWALSGVQPFAQTATTSEAQQLVQFRADERSQLGRNGHQRAGLAHRVPRRRALNAQRSSRDRAAVRSIGRRTAGARRR